MPQSTTSPPKQPEQETQHHAHEERSHQREVDAEAIALDDDVAGQPPQSQLGEPGPEQSQYNQDNAEDDECALHVVIATPPARALR